MNIETVMSTSDSNDAALVNATLSGDRDAFAKIVERYQSLICSLTYNATGCIAQSEDLAQETFFTAWKQMKKLREPEKLRSWLCGIARNIIAGARRRSHREPSQHAALIDEAHNLATPERATAERVIQKEEEAILWRSLEQVPEAYREALILFYRQGESIERVAQQLELSEDAVKQRLSRGRKLLAREVTAFVQGALKQSAPGRAFTFGVITSLPVFATSASAATISMGATKGSATAGSSAVVSWIGAFLGPLIGLFGAYIGVKASLDATRTARERAFVVREIKRMLGPMCLFALVLFIYIFTAERYWNQSPVLFGLLGVFIPSIYVVWIIRNAVRYNRVFQNIRQEEKMNHPDAFTIAEHNPPTDYRSQRTLLGLPLIHISRETPDGKKAAPAIGWIAFGQRAYGILFAAGGCAIGGISMGGISIGIVSFGGVSLGLLAIGGFALGGLAIGGAAIGIIAFGGLAVAWLGAQGGIAIAREFAIGGSALAQHANNPAANEFFNRFSWLDLRQMTNRNLIMMIIWLPAIISVAIWKRMTKARTRSSTENKNC